MGEKIKMTVPFDQLNDRVCPCGEKIFVQAFTLKELPALCSPSGIPETAMAHIGFACVTCGYVISLRPEVPPLPQVKLVGGN